MERQDGSVYNVFMERQDGSVYNLFMERQDSSVYTSSCNVKIVVFTTSSWRTIQGTQSATTSVVCLFVGWSLACLASQQHACVSHRRRVCEQMRQDAGTLFPPGAPGHDIAAKSVKRGGKRRGRNDSSPVGLQTWSWVRFPGLLSIDLCFPNCGRNRL